jgi:hypothetical protein
LTETVLLGRGREMSAIPRATWEGHLAQAPQHAGSRLAFMSDEHHQVRYHVVWELPRAGKPIPPASIAQSLELPLARVSEILDELERNLFFLARKGAEAVSWAYPVTVERTPHELTFSTGERLYGA